MRVTIPKDNLPAAMDWVTDNCPNFIRNEYHVDEDDDGFYDLNRFDLFFEPWAIDEMTMCALKFS